MRAARARHPCRHGRLVRLAAHPARRPDAVHSHRRGDHRCRARASPDSKARRCRASSLRAGRVPGVAIHARPEGRALLLEDDQYCLAKLLRSSPDPKAERCQPLVTDPQVTDRVAIHARPEGRALHRFTNIPPLTLGVAIHARPEGRALQPRLRVPLCRHRCCDPRPTRRPGAAPHCWPVVSDQRQVAIHARPEGRALPYLNRRSPSKIALRSTPDPKAGRCLGALRRIT